MRRQHGFGVIAAIAVLVILSSIAGAMVYFSANQSMAVALDVMSAKAWQAARSGNEWGLHAALKGGWSTCSGATNTLDMRAEAGVYVTVTCNSSLYQEGQDAAGVSKPLRVYEIRAVACPATSCPAVDASATGLGYVERSRVVIATSD